MSLNETNERESEDGAAEDKTTAVASAKIISRVLHHDHDNTSECEYIEKNMYI
jgi:hypothetical protein